MAAWLTAETCNQLAVMYVTRKLTDLSSFLEVVKSAGLLRRSSELRLAI